MGVCYPMLGDMGLCYENGGYEIWFMRLFALTNVCKAFGMLTK